MKRTKHILLTIAMLLCSLTASAHDFEVDGIYYSITSFTDLTVEVTYQGSYYDSYSNEYTGAVIIPATVTYNSKTYNVTGIGTEAFYNCENLTSITIPESVTSIREYAFHGTAWYDNQPDGVIYVGNVLYAYKGKMPVNTTIEVKEGTVSISPLAFSGCSNLTSINIPEGVTLIGYYAFQYCENLASITIPSSVTYIGYEAFYYCSSLTAVHISSIEAWCKIAFDYYGSNPLYYAHNLYLDGELVTNLVIPEGVTSIGGSAFSGCSNLISITIPESVTEIGVSAFKRCTSLKEVVIEDGITTLLLGHNSDYSDSEGGLFYDCPLERVYIGRGLSYDSNYGYSPFYRDDRTPAISLGNKITSIGDYLFYGNEEVVSITLPESVTSIGKYAFCSCGNLGRFTIPESSQLTSIGEHAFTGCSSLARITIPEGVSSIGNYAFSGCNGLASFTLPESMSSIGDYTFSGCSNLTSFTLPESVTSIGMYAFKNCENLERFTIPESSLLTSIGNYAFSGCSNFTSFTLPESVTSIGNDAFYGCWSLTDMRVNIASIESWLANNFAKSLGCFYSLYFNGELLTNAEVPSSVTTIPNYAFFRCSSLTSITLPEGVTSIGEEAFYNCSKLKAVSLPKTLSIIKKHAFYGCSSLESVIIPDAVEIIYQEAFAACNALESVTVLAVEPPMAYNNTFSNYEVVLYVPEGTTVAYQNTTPWDQFAMIGDVNSTVLYYKMISETDNTVEVTYKGDNHEEYSDRYSGAITIPETVVYKGKTCRVTKIGEWAFYGCRDLTSITIPESVTEIGWGAFCYCSSLTSLVIPKSVVRIDAMYPLMGCSRLTSVVVEEGNPVYDSRNDCNAIIHTDENILIGGCSTTFIPEGVTGLSYLALSGHDFTTITIPESMSNIGDWEFEGCRKLTTVTISKNIARIGTNAFSYCSALRDVYCYSEHVPESSSDAFDYTDLKLVTLHVPANSINNYKSTYPWSEFGEIVTIGNSDDTDDSEDGTESAITSLSQLSNTKLYYFSLPHHKGGIFSWGVAEGGEALNSNKQLGIEPDGNDSRQQFAVISNDGGTTRYLYHAAEKMFVNKDGSLNTWAKDPIYFKDGAYENTFVAYFDNQHYMNVGGTRDMEINSWNTSDGGNSCEILPVGDFDVQEALVAFPIEIDGVTYVKINEGEFEVYSADQVLSDLTILATITVEGNDYLVTSIGKSAFYGCSSLVAITIPEGVTSIGQWAFRECGSLNTVTLPASVTNIDVAAFEFCSSLTSITIPESVTSIENYTFNGCSRLTAITIPANVTSIGYRAFSGCSSLTTITIPENSQLTSIGQWAFRECGSLQEVRCYAESIPETPEGNAFEETPIENAMLYVPAALVEAYRTTAPWSGFGSINSLDDEPEEVKVCAEPTISYTDGIVSFLCETEGVTFKSTTVVEDAGDREVTDFELTATYVISVYATKEGYTDSEVTTATLCWVPCDENHGETTDIITIPAKPVLIQTDGGTITVNGLAAGTVVKVNDLNGVELGTATATGGTATITTGLTTGSVAIVQMGEYSVKVVIK